MILHLGRRTADELEARRRIAAAADVTYSHVGSSLRIDPRPGTQLRRSTESLGSGDDAFRAGCDAIRRWAPHAALGARVHPPDAQIEAGTTLLVILYCGPFEIVAPNRIVEVVDTPHAFGFAYGTLPGHPECGEESFLVRMDGTGTVSASVTVDAEPATWLTRLGHPVVRVIQDRAARRYAAGIAGAAL
ncbi:MAG: DUF1990 family protein [Acidimicrobiales bacterium]